MAYASLAISLREQEAAGTLFDLLAPHRRELPFDGVIPLEPFAMYLGGLAWVLGRDDEAEDLLSEARSLARVGGMKYAVALTELLWGTMLAAHEESQDQAKAQEILECACSAAVNQGYGMIERRTTALLAELNWARLRRDKMSIPSEEPRSPVKEPGQTLPAAASYD